MIKHFAIVLALATPAMALTPADQLDRGTRKYYALEDAGPAVAALQVAVRMDNASPMAHLMLSRALMRESQTKAAFDESRAALQRVADASDPESYLIRAWAAHMDATLDPVAHRHGEGDAIDAVDTGIAVYPMDPDLYILAGELAPTTLQRTPFYLAALKLAPQHPLRQRWRAFVPPVPDLPVSEEPPPVLHGAPIALFDGLGQAHIPVSARAQPYFDQGLRCLYGYVDNAARNSFIKAVELDPDCALGWWGLSFCPPPSITPTQLALHAWKLARAHGTDLDQRRCAVRVLELKGDSAGALDALGGALAAYPGDVDLWISRATFGGFAGEEDDRRSLQGLPFALAAWRLQPSHPSANHELIHTYEAIDRPVLGWRYTWGLRRSAPHLPHAQHMQAHLAMRLGRWKEALACTRASLRLSKAGYPELDHDHHLDVFFWAAGHEGDFREAMRVRPPEDTDSSWPRLLRLKLDDARLASWAHRRRTRFGDGWYFSALADLDRGRWREARNEIAIARRRSRSTAGEDVASWADELQGRLLLQSGSPARGLAKLEAVARWADLQTESHRWGQGAYYDELWGEAALQTHRLASAREAFQEAIAHEHGSVVAALGLQVVAELQHDGGQSKAFEHLARRIWSDADPGARERLLQRLRHIASAQAQVF